MDSCDSIYKHIAECAVEIPLQSLSGFFKEIRSLTQAPKGYERKSILQSVRTDESKTKLTLVLDDWEDTLPDSGGLEIERLFRASYSAIEASSLDLSLVWSGPPSNAGFFRRTDQALLELIQSAQKELLIVSYAAYRDQAIWDALKEAIKRGVTVRFFLEDKNDQDNFSGDINKAFSNGIFQKAEFYHWPSENRAKADDGKTVGSLHVKTAVSDLKRILITSANLTPNAMTQNMELGIVLNSSDIAQRVSELFINMVRDQIMVPFEFEDKNQTV